MISSINNVLKPAQHNSTHTILSRCYALIILPEV